MKKLINKYKKYFFRYRKGFYELPYFANSPATINAGYADAPFIKNDKANKRFIVNNIFIKATTTYYEIEEGLWIYYLDILHKKNIRFVPVYDDSITDNYYLFSFSEVRDNFKINIKKERRECYAEKTFWTIFKPLSNPDYLNNKNSNGYCITLYFSEAWLKKNILSNPKWSNSNVAVFFASSKKLISWNETQGLSPQASFNFSEMLLKNKNEFSLDELKTYANNLVQQFFNSLEHASDCNYFELDRTDRDKLFLIEKYLLENLDGDFMGIDFLADKAGVSATKLKADFKTHYGLSIFQYFRQKQMQLAEQLIKSQSHSISEIALKLGYENASKFAIAFKECQGVSPSEV